MTRLAAARLAAIAWIALIGACASSNGDPTATGPEQTAAPVHVVLFTHVEDNTPAGISGSATHRANYLTLRTRLIEMATLARRYNARWWLQPDWSLLLAALQYEDSTLRASTRGLNMLRYLRDSLAVAIDPHSHEGGGYNYTDVAHLLDSLGVGGSTVVGAISGTRRSLNSSNGTGSACRSRVAVFHRPVGAETSLWAAAHRITSTIPS